MYLSVDSAINFVRTHLDEIVSTAPDMLGSGELDDRNLETTVSRLMEEAIVYVHLQCLPELLEGISIPSGSSPEAVVEGEVLDIDFSEKDIKILRLVSFKESSSKVLITSAVHEDSTSGKLQQNKYLRGTDKDPILVYQRDSKDLKPHYKYYTTKQAEPSFSMLYFPYPELDSNNGYFISAKLMSATLNHLMGLVAQSYYLNEQANLYFAKVKEEITI